MLKCNSAAALNARLLRSSFPTGTNNLTDYDHSYEQDFTSDFEIDPALKFFFILAALLYFLYTIS